MKAVIELQTQRGAHTLDTVLRNGFVQTVPGGWRWEDDSHKVWIAGDAVETVTEPVELAGQWTFVVRTRSGDETRAAYTLESTARAAARQLVDAMIHPEFVP